MENDETLERKARRLRERIESLDRYATAPYPEKIRRRVAAFVHRARRAERPWTWKRLAETLGINHTSISKWHDAYGDDVLEETAPVASMVPVELTHEPTEPSVDETEGICVEFGEARLCGLSFEEAVEAARRLG